MDIHDSTAMARWDDRAATATMAERVCGFASDNRMADERVLALGSLVTGAMEAAHTLGEDDALCVRVAMDEEWLTLMLDGEGETGTTMTLEFAVEPETSRLPSSLLVVY